MQFETIHPYLGGNGRIERLLVTLLLQHWGVLTRPLLYLSLHFKRHRSAYYRALQAVREDGEWEGWLEFYLGGVVTVADEAVATSQDLFELVSDDRRRLLEHPATTLTAVKLLDLLPRHPVVTVAWVVDRLATTKPTAGAAIAALESAGILVETTRRKRDRVYAYAAYVDRLRTGTELE